MNPNRWAQTGALLLAVTMFIFVIAKAQGCQRPSATDEPAAAKEPTATTGAQMSGATGSTANAAPNGAGAASGADAGEPRDAGSSDSGSKTETPKQEPVIRVLPATKSGAIRVLDDDDDAPGLLQHRGSGGLKKQNVDPGNK